MSDPSFDSAQFRQVLGKFPTGVCVVAAMAGEQPVGMAIGSFFSISLEPPLVGFCAGTSSSTWPKIRDAGRFCVTILGADQQDVCNRFASKDQDKFAGIEWDSTDLGSPRIGGNIGWIDCELSTTYDGGDHDIAVGAVHGLSLGGEQDPLVFFGGGYRQLV